jgi:hypothetical protein
MAKKRKIIITEAQYQVIKESENVISDFRDTCDDIIKITNAQFGRLAFSSMADVLDGDIDLDVVDRKMHELEMRYYNGSKRVSDFFKHHTSEDEYWEKWERVDQELEGLGYKALHKIEAIQSMISVLQNLADLDAEERFSDIQTRKI